MLKRLFVPVLAVIDIALLIIIIVSPGLSDRKASVEDYSAPEVAVAEALTEATAGPELDAAPKDDHSIMDIPAVSEETAIVTSEQENTELSQTPFSDISAFDTSER